ncbi:coiled-coil domain-containing protein [Geomonas anaerohicana]|uniref:Chromosome segregation ATPase n=1 Tax=Geomonas anaerohicana TaxID=2798583 RepID=A0ABS0YL57_9BACT|nr:hypothetical protein [Geomonas anaerohicana]MBJ6752599.1 hypothetical protein [Geomonas anaerohicana]
MLTLDSSIGCIEVSESEVVDLYRSAPITRSSDQHAQTMEAYICAVRKKTLVKVYLALVVNDCSIYVYSSPGKGKSEQDYPGEVEKSLSYARAMGFAPERVDLSYSPAMREVVVRNTKILRLPGSKGAGLKHGMACAPVLPMLQQSADTAPEPAVTLPAPAAIPLPAAAPTSLPLAHDSQGGDLLAALAQLQHEQQTLTAERDALATQLQQLSTQHHEAVKELSAARTTGEDIAGARETLDARQRQADETLAARDSVIADLQKQVADLTLEREALATQNAELSRSQDAMLENLALARQDIAALCGQRDGARADSEAAAQQQRETAARLDEAREELERAAGEAADTRQRVETLEEAVRSKEQELAALRQELAGVSSERDAALQQAAAHPADEGADAEADRLRQELDQVAAERDTALAQLAAAGEAQAREAEESGKQVQLHQELAQLRLELERVESERDAALQRVAAREETAPAPSAPADLGEASGTGCRPGEETFPSRVLPGLQDAGPEPLSSGTKSVLPTFTESALPPFAELLSPPQMGHPWDTPAEVAEPAPPEDGGAGFAFGEQETSFLPLGDLQEGFFTAGDDGAAVRFLLESGMDAIDCPAAEDVLELHQSINNAYLSPEGTGGQESCQGYICCLRKGDEKAVFAAIYGTKSHRTRVYLPETQPRDDESYARTVRGAVSFAEEVGLMMERVPLEAPGPKRQERLKRCPALRLAYNK